MHDKHVRSPRHRRDRSNIAGEVEFEIVKQQIYAMQTARELNILPQHVIEDTIAEFTTTHQCGNKKPHVWYFEAMKHILDKKEPDYKN